MWPCAAPQAACVWEGLCTCTCDKTSGAATCACNASSAAHVGGNNGAKPTCRAPFLSQRWLRLHVLALMHSSHVSACGFCSDVCVRWEVANPESFHVTSMFAKELVPRLTSMTMDACAATPQQPLDWLTRRCSFRAAAHWACALPWASPSVATAQRVLHDRHRLIQGHEHH